MKRANVKDNTYIDFVKESKNKHPQFNLSWWSYQNININVRICTIPWTYVISNLNFEETVETFYEKELQKRIKKNLE